MVSCLLYTITGEAKDNKKKEKKKKLALSNEQYVVGRFIFIIVTRISESVECLVPN